MVCLVAIVTEIRIHKTNHTSLSEMPITSVPISIRIAPTIDFIADDTKINVLDSWLPYAIAAAKPIAIPNIEINIILNNAYRKFKLVVYLVERRSLDVY